MTLSQHSSTSGCKIGRLHHYLRNRGHRSSIDLGAERLEQRRELGAAEDVDLVDGALVEDLLHHAPDLRSGTTSSSHTLIASLTTVYYEERSSAPSVWQRPQPLGRCPARG